MHANGHHTEPLPPPTDEATRAHLDAVIAALGDTPETVITLHFLQKGACEVLVVGDPAQLEGLIVQTDEVPEEPSAYGNSAEAIASLLPHLSGWACINVPIDLADDLVEPVARVAEAAGVRMVDDVFHTLTKPVVIPAGSDARLLTVAETDLIRNASPALVGTSAQRVIDTLEWGHVAGVERNGELVAIGHTFAVSPKHADIGVVTHPEWREQGFATAVGAVVAQAIQAEGRIPVWSAGGTNLASLRAAARLGFVETSRRVYLVPEFADD